MRRLCLLLLLPSLAFAQQRTGRQVVTGATASKPGTIQLGGDIAGTSSAPQVKSTHLVAPLPESQGGTNASSVGAAQVTATGSTTARTLADRWADVVNVKDFGAKGDGTTDDTAAIQRAITALPSSGGQVFFPAGTYQIASGLTVPNHAWLAGPPGYAATLRFTYSDSSTAITFAASSYYQGIRDLNIAHANAYDYVNGTDGGQGTAVFMSTSTYAGLERVRISNFVTGVRVNGEATWLHMTDVMASFSGTAFSLAQANLIYLLRVIADTNQRSFYLYNLAAPVLDTCTAQVNYDATVGAVQIIDTVGAEIVRLWTERNASLYTVDIKGTSNNTRISESLLSGAGYRFDTQAFTGAGTGIRIAGTVWKTWIDGALWGANGTRDLQIDSGATGVLVLEPHKEQIQPPYWNTTPLSQTTGTLPAGTYAYRVTSIDSSGETTPNAEQTITTDATGGVIVRWYAVAGSSGYKIYGRSAGAEQLLASVGGGSTVTWTDDGSLTPSGALPTANTTVPAVLYTDSGTGTRWISEERFIFSPRNVGSLSNVRISQPMSNRAQTSSWTPDASAAAHQAINVTTTGAAITVNAPTNPVTGQDLTLLFRNNAGAGATFTVSWGSGVKAAAFTAPANGFSRSVTFRYDGTNWIEVSRTPSDVPN